VLDGRGRWVESFGERGRQPGQFDHPSDATLVMPMFEGEDAVESAYTALVAVADRMNHRVQIFELAGQFVAALGRSTPGETRCDIPKARCDTPAGGAYGVGPDRAVDPDRPVDPDNVVDPDSASVGAERDGWPFFRVTPDMAFNEPIRVRWRAPWLEVTEAGGAVHRIDLAYAMLPRFEDWLAAATPHVLVSAQHHLRFCIRQTAGIALPLLQIESTLGQAWLHAGDVDAVARLWSLPWPAGIDADRIRAEATRRDRFAISTAFMLGSAHRVLGVRAALRAALPGPAVLAPALTRHLEPEGQKTVDRKAVGE
jgi:hypothetical protein